MRRLLQEEWPFREGLFDEGTLAIDVAENDREIRVRASAPGFRREDIEVQVDQGVLSIQASRAEAKEEKGERRPPQSRRARAARGGHPYRPAHPREGAGGTRPPDRPELRIDPGVVVDRIRSRTGAFGIDGARGELVDLAAAGILDPAKVVRIALENAASIAGTLLLAEATMTEIVEQGEEREAATAY